MTDFYKYNESYTDQVQRVRHDLIQGRIKVEDVIPSLLAIEYKKGDMETLTLDISFSLFAPAGKTKATLASLEVDNWGGMPVDPEVLKQFTLVFLQKRLRDITQLLVTFREAYYKVGLLTAEEIRGSDEYMALGEQIETARGIVRDIQANMPKYEK